MTVSVPASPTFTPTSPPRTSASNDWSVSSAPLPRTSTTRTQSSGKCWFLIGFYTFFYLRCAGSTLFFRVDLLRAKKVKVTGNSFFLLVRSTQFEILLTNFLSFYLQCDELFCSCILQEVHEHAQERRLHWRRLKMPTHQVHSHRLVKKQQKKPFQEDVPSIFFSFKLTATEDDDYIKTTKNNLFVTDNLPPPPLGRHFFFLFFGRT